MSDYHSRKERSSSEVAMFLSEPVKWWHVYKEKDWKNDPTPAMDVGNVIHTMLEKGTTETEYQGKRLYAVIPDEVLNDDGHRKGKKWTDWAAANPAWLYFKSDEPNMLKVVWEHAMASDWIREVMDRGIREMEHIWHDSVLGECRMKSDLVIPPGVDIEGVETPALIDWKTTTKASKWQFASHIGEFWYHVRMAFYVRGYRDKYGCNPSVYLVAVDTGNSYRLRPYQLTPEELDAAEALLLKTVEDMNNFDVKRELNVKPQPLRLPAFKNKQIEEMIEEALA